MLRIVQKLVARESADPADLEGLNLALSGGPMILRMEESDSGYRLEFTPIRTSWSVIAAEAAAYLR